MELYCGYMAEEFHRLNIWLAERAQTSQKSHFHMESIMAGYLHIERTKADTNYFLKEAFTVMLRLSNKQFAEI